LGASITNVREKRELLEPGFEIRRPLRVHCCSTLILEVKQNKRFVKVHIREHALCRL